MLSTVLPVLAIATLVPASAGAQSTQGSALADASHAGQELLNYQLTLPRANQLIAALDAMTKYLVSRPDFKDRLLSSLTMTPAEKRAQLEGDPQAMAILKKNGLAAPDYLVGIPALRMALMAAQAPPGAPNLAVSPANLAFAKANLAQLKPRLDAADGIRPAK